MENKLFLLKVNEARLTGEIKKSSFVDLLLCIRPYFSQTIGDIGRRKSLLVSWLLISFTNFIVDIESLKMDKW